MARYYYFLFFLTVLSNCQGQLPKEQDTKNEYQDFVLVDQQIWALTNQGKLSVFDLPSGKRANIAPTLDSPIVAISKDRHSNIAVALTGKVKIFDRSLKSWSDLGNYAGRLYGIVFDSANKCFLITNNGIEELSTHKLYFSDSSMNDQIHYRKQWSQPNTYCCDRDNNIWIGFGYGEWGGNLLVFNIGRHNFLFPKLGEFKLELSPIKCIFPADSTVYLSSGLQHMSLSGSIMQFDHLDARFVFASEDSRDRNENGEYIGPAAFNPSDHCIYFYSQNGIFKGNPEEDLTTIAKWRKVASPKLTWTYGQPDAIGYSMNVLKMEFTRTNTLVLLTQSNGIGIFDNGKIFLIK
jgi:hypothetical protein